MKHFPIDKAIIIIRHPLDVFVSLYNYYELDKYKLDELVNYFSLHHTLPILKKFNFPSWSEHLKSWINSNVNYYLFKYSDLINDFDTISELTSFVSKGYSYEAESGHNDDLVMTLVLFSWVATQPYFKELTDMDIRKTMMKEQQDSLEQDMAPFGFVVTGLEDENIGQMVDEYGTRWSPIVRDHRSDW